MAPWGRWSSESRSSLVSPVGTKDLAIPSTAIWAKSARGIDGVAGAGFHPLVCHLNDVASVAGALWPLVTGDELRRRLAAGLSLTEADTGALARLLAALHDIGKATPAFQSVDAHQIERLEQLGLALKAPTGPTSSHGALGAAIIEDWLADSQRLADDSAHSLGVIAGGHHGKFPTALELERVTGRELGEGAPWPALRADIINDLRRAAPTLWPRSVSPPAAVILAGVTSVADWIGSRSEDFPLASPGGGSGLQIDVDAYGDRVDARAHEVIAGLGWGLVPSPGPPRPFGELFPGLMPRAVQNAAIEIAESMTGPAFVVIESETGSGKTEAALAIAEHAISRLGARGLYLALPTQATSDQMFQRVRAFLDRRYAGEPVNLQLLHAARAFSDDFASLLKAPTPSEPEEPTLGVVAAEWFTGAKRGLLAPFAVGTIDQALLATLETRHFFVRMLGLAGRCVVIDEVHAYDAYMSTLLERLLEWLGALGSTVLLLSATLPRDRRSALLASYARGAGMETPGSSVGSAPYPRIAWAREGSTGERSLPPAASRRLVLERVVARNEDVCPPELAARLTAGGCAAAIYNTVKDAQSAYEVLRVNPRTAGIKVALLHARFRRKERRELERDLLDALGPDERRPDGLILVATQVVEQSLDIDFDFMATWIAPVDLLLQRAGRLHRHTRVRPSSRRAAHLAIVSPGPETDGTYGLGRSRWVYDEHVLLRTLDALVDLPAIDIPGDVERLVEHVYGTDQPWGEMTPALDEQWNRSRVRLRTQREADEQFARSVRILPPDDPDFLADDRRELAEEDPEAHPALQALTRLGPPSVELVILTHEEAGGIDLETPPPPRLAAWLADRSCRLASQPLAREFLLAGPHPAWSGTPMLRRHRLVVLDPELRFVSEGGTLSYDFELGVRTG